MHFDGCLTVNDESDNGKEVSEGSTMHLPTGGGQDPLELGVGQVDTLNPAPLPSITSCYKVRWLLPVWYMLVLALA